MLISEETYHNIILKPFEAKSIINEVDTLCEEHDVDIEDYPALMQLVAGIGWVAERIRHIPLEPDFDIPTPTAEPEPDEDEAEVEAE